MKLNGWQRLGIVLSALWVIYVLVEFNFSSDASIKQLLAALFFPILAFWVIAYGVLFAFRWVRDGFKNDSKPASSGAEQRLPALAPDKMFNPVSIPMSRVKSGVSSRQQIAFSTLLAIFLSLAYWKIFMYALDGRADAFHKNELGSFLFASGFAFWYFWRRLNRKGWIGAIVGVAVSLSVIFLGAAVAGYVRGQPNYILEHTPAFAAIKKSYPEDYEKIHQILVAKSKDKKKSVEDFAAEMTPILQGVFRKALRSTSDDALLQFGRAKVQMFQEVAASNAEDCVMLMLEGADLTSQMRIMESISKETQEAINDANIRVLNDAGSTIVRAVKDSIRFEALFDQLDETMTTTYGTSAYYFSDESLNKPAEVRCEAGLLLFMEVQNLPPQDRSFMLREFFGEELEPVLPKGHL